MANATIRFDVSGVQELRSKIYATKSEMRLALLRLALIRAKKREQRAYLNMLRSTRRTRKTMVRKWELAKLHVKVCAMRVDCPTALIIAAQGTSAPPQADRRTILLGHRLSVAEIDECPVEILAISDER